MAASVPMAGQLLAHYRIVERIGAGGMGVVYRAHDERLDRDVALKILPPGIISDEFARKRFRKEALTLSKLSHPNIAVVLDFDRQEEVDFLVMELIPGITLDKKIPGQPVPEKEAILLGEQIAKALEEAHEHGIVHRDLKPGNIMVSPKGQLRVLDFGLAKLVRLSETAATESLIDVGSGAGTLPYMAPEQLQDGRADARTDIYAAGAVLYEMVTGKRPHPEPYGAPLMNAILNRSPEKPGKLNPDVSPALETVILKALEKYPDERYQTASELLADLGKLRESGTIQPVGKPRVRLYKWVVVLAVAVVLVVAAWFVHRVRQSERSAKRPVILVGDFENRTSEPVFNQTLRELLSSAIEQSPYLSIFPQSRVPDVLRQMERAPDERIDENLGREICHRAGLQAFLTGSITRLGNSYVLFTHVVTPSGKSLVALEQNIAKAEDIPPQLDAVAQRLRRTLGESLQSVAESSAPLAQVTSSSLDAVRYFTVGKQHMYQGDMAQAALFFQKAIELDPNFAMAHEYLGATYTNIDDPVRAETQLYRATQLLDRVSDVEKQKILGDYYFVVGDYDRACGYYQALTQLQPEDPAPYLNLGVCYSSKLDFNSAIAATQKAVQLLPRPGPRANLASIYFLKGDTATAQSIARDVLRENPAYQEAQRILGKTFLVSGQLADAQQVFQKMVLAGGDQEVEGRSQLADLALAIGNYRQARSQLEAGIIATEKRQNAFSALKYQVVLAQLSLEQGTTKQASRDLAQVKKPGTDPVLIFLTGSVYARAHRFAEASGMLALLSRLAEEKKIQKVPALKYLLEAELALERHNPTVAVAAAGKAVQYENSTLALESLGNSYAAAGRDEDAIQQYERVLARGNERSETYDSPGFHNVVKTYYKLGVLYQKDGRTDQAREHLQKFLQYWSAADSDLAIYRDAKERLRLLSPARRSGMPTPAA